MKRACSTGEPNCITSGLLGFEVSFSFGARRRLGLRSWIEHFLVLIFGKVRLLVSFWIGSVSSRLLLLRRPFVSLGQCLVPSHDRAHAAVSPFGRARRNARQVPAPRRRFGSVFKYRKRSRRLTMESLHCLFAMPQRLAARCSVSTSRT